MKWGQGSPMLDEDAFLDLLRQATDKGFFSQKFLVDLYHELGKALKYRQGFEVGKGSPASEFGEGLTNGRHQKGKAGRPGKRSHKEIL